LDSKSLKVSKRQLIYKITEGKASSLADKIINLSEYNNIKLIKIAYHTICV